MPATYVGGLISDKKGYLWFATIPDLCRYNGSEFVNCTEENGFPFVSAFHIDNDARGRVWFINLDFRIGYYEDHTFHKFPETYVQISWFDRAYLEQNIPNPFTENTMLPYYVPYTAQSASINVADMNGKVLRSFSIHEKGKGQVTLPGGSFAAGVYLYELVVDGQKVDSKRMVFE